MGARVVKCYPTFTNQQNVTRFSSKYDDIIHLSRQKQMLKGKDYQRLHHYEDLIHQMF